MQSCVHIRSHTAALLASAFWAKAQAWRSQGHRCVRGYKKRCYSIAWCLRVLGSTETASATRQSPLRAPFLIYYLNVFPGCEVRPIPPPKARSPLRCGSLSAALLGAALLGAALLGAQFSPRARRSHVEAPSPPGGAAKGPVVCCRDL
jgi:hypothetical protein